MSKPWSDNPYYETGYQKSEETKSERTWGCRTKQSDTSSSPLVNWYHTENAKRQKNLENEIDIADIKAATRGTKNPWFGAASKHPEKFSGLVDGKKTANWDELTQLKRQS